MFFLRTIFIKNPSFISDEVILSFFVYIFLFSVKDYIVSLTFLSCYFGKNNKTEETSNIFKDILEMIKSSMITSYTKGLE